MEVVEMGHRYKLWQLDGDDPQVLTFVNREKGREHPGIQNQEALRAVIDVLECLVDRVNYLDEKKQWRCNHEILKFLTEAQRMCRNAILYHEFRALEMKSDKEQVSIENMTIGSDGHFLLK